MSDEKLVAYCGLCCRDCHSFQQKIPDLARDLRAELRKSKYKKFAASLSTTAFGKAFCDYDKCYEVLGAMVKFRCNKGCKNGGGPPFCKIRGCCEKKKIEGCWECDIFEKCEKLDFLKPVHEEAHIKNLKIIKKKGIAEFLENKRNW
jgi:hypothetical protein